MMTLMVEGGLPMWFILALGLVALASAAAFAARPSTAREGFVTRTSRATACATIVGLASAVGTTFHHAGNLEMAHEQRMRMAMVGLGESMAPVIVGFGLLTLVALLSAIGRAKLDAS